MSAHQSEPARILLIEDEPDINLLTKTALTVKGYHVLSVMNGVDGIEEAKRQQFDLILLDVSMPDMDGYEVFEKLRSMPETRGISVVFFSAYVQESDIQRGLALGALGYIKKPFDPVTLPDEVGGYLKNARLIPKGDVKQAASSEDDLTLGYVRRLDEKRDQLAALLDGQAFDDIQVLGHRLAGSGASYGFPGLSRIGSEIEEQAKAKDLRALKELYGKLDAEIATVKRSQE